MCHAIRLIYQTSPESSFVTQILNATTTRAEHSITLGGSRKRLLFQTVIHHVPVSRNQENIQLNAVKLQNLVRHGSKQHQIPEHVSRFQVPTKPFNPGQSAIHSTT